MGAQSDWSTGLGPCPGAAGSWRGMDVVSAPWSPTQDCLSLLLSRP